MEQKQDLKQLSDGINEKHKNFVVSVINDSCLRMAVNEGIYDWHYHPDSDELFVVLEGKLEIEFQDKDRLALGPGETITIPRGTIHRTIARQRTVNLCFERLDAGTIFI